MSCRFARGYDVGNHVYMLTPHVTPQALSELDRRRQGRVQRASLRAARLTLTTWAVNSHFPIKNVLHFLFRPQQKYVEFRVEQFYTGLYT